MTPSKLKKHLSNLGVNIPNIIKQARAAIPDEWGGNEHIPVAKGITVRYITNPNYGGGPKNGWGSGVYATLHCTGFKRDVAIERDCDI